MEEVNKRISFCGGICQEWKRYNKQCNICKKYLCKICEVLYENKVYCVNCIPSSKEIIKDLKEEFKDMFK